MNFDRVPPLDPHQGGLNFIRLSPQPVQGQFSMGQPQFDFTQQQQSMMPQPAFQSTFQQQQMPTQTTQQQFQWSNQTQQPLMLQHQPQPPQHVFKLADPSMEIVDRMIEKFIAQDNMFPSLIDKMRITCESGVTVSGLLESDYSTPNELPVQVHINQFKIINKVPLPPEILEQVGIIQPDTLMGVFPEISRAWVSIESDLYIWDFETGGDVAYYDGACDIITSVGLVPSRPDVFHQTIKHLLIITTPLEIIVLGIVLNQAPDKQSNELQLTHDIIYSLPTEGVPIKVVKGTVDGRIFMGGQDGNVFELVYQKEIGWWGKRCKKVNISKSSLSFIVPSFIAAAFTEVDPIRDIVVDDSRNILYTLTTKGTIDVYDLGKCGTSSAFKVATLSHSSIHHQAVRAFFFHSTQQLIQHTRRDLPEITAVCSLCVIEETDSPHLGLIGLTKSGIRLYFSTGSPPPHRPSTLRLLHIRFPPGLNPSSLPFMRDSLTVPMHKAGTFIMATTNTAMVQDKVWCFSSDFFPARINFSEETQFHNLCAPVVALADLSLSPSIKENSKPVYGPSGHILVYQQNIDPNRFILLTPQGTEVYEKLRPVDILAEVLREKNGPDCNEIKQYFLEQGTDQACAMALILACNFMTTQAQLAEWATRAFFLYGGDPKHIIQPAQHFNINQPNFGPGQVGFTGNQPDMAKCATNIFDNTRQSPDFGLPTGFRPTQVSTPISDRNRFSSPGLPATLPAQSETFTIQMSSKHNGLYLYLTRILRPIWAEKIVSSVIFEDNKQYYVSSLSLNDLGVLTARLTGLKNFLEKNTTQASQDIPTLSIRDAELISRSNLRMRLQEALAQEKMSLDAFKVFVEHVTQVFNLWRILCQHQFHVIIGTLKPELINQMSLATFRDLSMCGKELCSALINGLINLYLNDNASVDNISAKLREVCPTLYKSEDATCSKVNEILMSVKDVRSEEEKLVMLSSAIKLCKEVAPHLNHSSVCKQLVNHQYYQGVIEVCCDMANKADPHNLAKSFLMKNQPLDDDLGSKAFMNRSTCYKDLAYMLDQIYMKCQIGNTPVSFDEPPSTIGQKILEDTIIQCLNVEDETAHLVVYEWLVTRNLQNSLVTLGKPSVEKYLSRFPPDSKRFRDLMWQYYERSGDHAKAALILYKLATGRGDAIKLQQRLTYLGKAVMCMRSDEVGCAPHLGVFHHELEDLVQVTRVQKQVLDKISGMINTHSMAEEACKKLNSNLLSITELFEDFAEPFQLWECKLTILNCAGHDDQELIKSIWNEIIKYELDQCTSSLPDEQMLVVMSKVKSLGLQYTIQSPCFPVYYLVWQLELLSCRLDVNKSRVYTTMIETGVSVAAMLDIYDKMFSANDICWSRQGNEFHLIQVIASFADSFVTNTRMVTASEWRVLADQVQELVTSCLSTLFSKQDCAQLISFLKKIKENLERFKSAPFSQQQFF
ncbi:nuclear pore complex protein Nup154 isoform X1 [Cimex lectularius]|uniref:Nuclear pore complex protein Nup155 n=1 Tax=Cimex lectularius TaxID=79782 RepID=A0A8I6SJV9_CIMLE|nr:nuclear pore complex protein Nup154 isoform X1 [Cimex lectularius]XP_024084606.1 nuclear pore complex protein Nup154 isoform X1 [Cimex lectularius]